MNTRKIRNFLPWRFLPCLALCLLCNHAVFTKGIQFLLLAAWLLMLQLSVYAEVQSQLNLERVKALSELRDINMGDLIGSPDIELKLHYGKVDELPSDLRSNSEFKALSESLLLETAKKDAEDKSNVYVKVSEYIKRNPTSPFKEWLFFHKADLLLRSQLSRAKPQWSFPLEDYELAVRTYPSSPYVVRALYQIAYIKLRSELFQEVDQVVERALEEFNGNRFSSDFMFLDAEQAFRAGDYESSLSGYSKIMKMYPKAEVAVDAAYRRAFILFKEEKFKAALETYKALEKYHADAFKVLQMKSELQNKSRFIDRLYYGETLYLTANYSEASEIYQNLANLYPNNIFSPIMWIRFADTFFARGKISAALEIYEFIYSKEAVSPIAKAVAAMRMADTYFMTDSIQAQLSNNKLYRAAFGVALENDLIEIGSLSLLKLSLYDFENKSYQKSKSVLERYFEYNPKGGRNHNWAQDMYSQLVELEILDHYHAGDYLAALTVYLVKNQDERMKFRNVEVLLRLADAARSLSLLGEAEKILNRVIYLESNTGMRQEALLNLVELLIERKDLAKASERLRRFNFAYPKTKLDYLYEYEWAQLYLGLENDKSAVRHFENAVELAKKNAGSIYKIRFSYIRLGELYAKLNLPLKSVEAYRSYLFLFKDKNAIKLKTIPYTNRDDFYSKVAHYRIADIYFNTRDFVKALHAYQQVKDKIKEEPFHSHAQYRIGESYLALNDRAAALEAFKKVKSDDAKNLWLRAAQSYMKSVEMEVQNGIRIFN